VDVEPDPYTSEVYRWWHLETPSPEIKRALEEGWLEPGQRVLDLGCGLASELAYLASQGLQAYGIDVSAVALLKARTLRPGVHLIRGDVLHLPFSSQSFDALLDRGCFHYVPEPARRRYVEEAERVLRPGGRMLMRACLDTQGEPNGLDEQCLRDAFDGWSLARLGQHSIPSDSRDLDALVAYLVKQPAGVH
jgi:SAM-dependent methyltransferase